MVSEKIMSSQTLLTGGKTVESSLSGRTGIKLKDLGDSSNSDSKSEGNFLKDTSSDLKEYFKLTIFLLWTQSSVVNRLIYYLQSSL